MTVTNITDFRANAKAYIDAIINDNELLYLIREGNEQALEIMYQKYANYIQRIISTKRGNYLVFFPSYQFMEEVVV